MSLFTLILEYAGGTYVSQVEAEDENNALALWISRLRLEGIAGAASDDIASAFAGELDNLVKLEDLINAWCTSANASQGLALVNLVRTAN